MSENVTAWIISLPLGTSGRSYRKGIYLFTVELLFVHENLVYSKAISQKKREGRCWWWKLKRSKIWKGKENNKKLHSNQGSTTGHRAKNVLYLITKYKMWRKPNALRTERFLLTGMCVAVQLRLVYKYFSAPLTVVVFTEHCGLRRLKSAACLTV